MWIFAKRRLKRRVMDLEDLLVRKDRYIAVLARIVDTQDNELHAMEAEVRSYEARVGRLNAELAKTPARGKDGRYRKRETTVTESVFTHGA